MDSDELKRDLSEVELIFNDVDWNRISVSDARIKAMGRMFAIAIKAGVHDAAGARTLYEPLLRQVQLRWAKSVQRNDGQEHEWHSFVREVSDEIE